MSGRMDPLVVGSGSYSVRAPAAAADFDALKAEFRARGWYVRPTMRVLVELGLHISTFIGGLAILLSYEGAAPQAIGLLLVTLGHLGVGTNTHTSAHYATSRTPWINEALTFFGYAFFLQVSATYWWDKHNVRHHPHANVVGLDPDADISPWFALTEQQVRRHHGFRRW